MHPRVPATRWGRRVPIGHYREKETVDVRLARALGCKRNTAHQLLWGRNSLRCKLIAVILAFDGERDRFAHWWAPVGLALYAVRGTLDQNTLDILAQRAAVESTKRQLALFTGDWSQYERALEVFIEAAQCVLAGIRQGRGEIFGREMQ